MLWFRSDLPDVAGQKLHSAVMLNQGSAENVKSRMPPHLLAILAVQVSNSLFSCVPLSLVAL